MTQSLGIGLVGYGGIGRVHALCYQMLPLMYPDAPQARIVAVSSGSASSAQRARTELGVVDVGTSLDALLANPAVQIVDCCAPTGDHGAIIEAALRAGKAVFCEKPLAATATEAARLATLADELGIVCGTNYHLRGAPAIQALHRRAQAGDFGTVYGFHFRYHRSSNIRRDRALTWRSRGPGSGVLQDLGSHMIDLVQHLLGPVVRVAAHTRIAVAERRDNTGTLRPVEADDIAWLSVELADGGRGTIEASKMVPGAADDIRIEGYGERVTFSADLREPNHVYVASVDGPSGGQRLAVLNTTTPAVSIPGSETPSGWAQWHLASIVAYLTNYAAGMPSNQGLHQAVQVQQVIDAALASANNGGAWVDVAPAHSANLHKK